MKVPLQALGERPRACNLYSCLQRKKFCGHKFLCQFEIPGNSVKLQKLAKRKKVHQKSVGCSQTQWTWTVLDQQTGNLNLKIRNKNWVSTIMYSRKG